MSNGFVRKVGRNDLSRLGHVRRFESRDIKDISPRFMSEQAKDRAIQSRKIDVEELHVRTMRRGDTFSILKLLLIPGVLLWLFVGPVALVGGLTIMSKTPWPFWILLIFIGILLWRR